MLRNATLKPLVLSDQVYQALLVVYPATHRYKYGPLMAQVFRDMCRDAYRQHGAFGLAQLWLHTLIDMAVTAIIEHLDEKGRVLVENILETKGLVSALQALSNQLTETGPFTVHLAIDGRVPRLRKQAESAIFNVIGEAVANAKAHAQADNIWVTVRCQEDTLDVSVRDDGRGFDVDAVRAEYEARGEPGEIDMSNRVETLQGTLSVQSTISEGTAIHLVAPLAPNLETDTE